VCADVFKHFISEMLRTVTLLVALGLASASNAAGKKFLEENKGKPGVITLPSGLQYKVLRAGDGDSHPTADSSCECHYEGRTAQKFPAGETFDSSYARGSPTSFAPNQVIKGWCADPLSPPIQSRRSHPTTCVPTLMTP
jgi:FKBP-type peptidyl-prolyl cis-trans isomerase